MMDETSALQTELLRVIDAIAAIEAGGSVYVSIATVASIKFTDTGRTMILNILRERRKELQEQISG